MSSFESLVTRIRGEYREMPGLRLTLAQACRLWQLDSGECSRALNALVAQQFLRRTSSGSFVCHADDACHHIPSVSSERGDGASS
jgi:hypothetical protein